MAELARDIIGIIEIVLMGGSVTAPFKTISELVDRFLFPDFPGSALPQFYSILGLNAALGVISIACIVVRLKMKNFFLFSIRDRYIVINTPIIFSALLLAYIISVELVIWRTSEVFNGKHAYENLILYRMFAWLTLWLGGYYKGYGIVIAASVKAQATQMGLSSQRFSRRPRSLSILFGIVLPLLYSATIIATHVWSNVVCNRSFEAYERVTKTLLLLQNTPDVNIQQSIFQLVTPLTELMELGTTCFMAKRVLFGSWAGWLVIVFFVGGYAFFIMAKALKSQIRVLEQVLNGIRRLEQTGNRQSLLEATVTLKTYTLQNALFNLRVHAFGLFASSLSYLGATSLTLAVGARAQTDGKYFATINLWFFWTFIVFGTPGLILNFQSGIDDGSFIGLPSSSSLRREPSFRHISGSSAMEAVKITAGQPLTLMPSRVSSSRLGTDEHVVQIQSDPQQQPKAIARNPLPPHASKLRNPKDAFRIADASSGSLRSTAGKPSTWKERNPPISL